MGSRRNNSIKSQAGENVTNNPGIFNDQESGEILGFPIYQEEEEVEEQNSSETAKFVCSHCSKVCASNASLKKHVFMAHQGKFACTNCGERFLKLQLKKEHENSCMSKSINQETTPIHNEHQNAKETKFKGVVVKESNHEKLVKSTDSPKRERTKRDGISDKTTAVKEKAPDKLSNKVPESVSSESQLCEMCPKKPEFRSTSDLRSHVRAQHQLTLQEYSSKVSNKVKQVEYMSKSKTFLTACKICFAILVSQSGFETHIQEVHGMNSDEYNSM